MHCTRMNGDWHGAIERARAHAPFLALALDRQPALAEPPEKGRRTSAPRCGASGSRWRPHSRSATLPGPSRSTGS
jgi:hypothetical protein